MWDLKRALNITSKPSATELLLEQIAERSRQQDTAAESLRRQNKTLLEAIVADSAAKTALLDRIVGSKFDRPVLGGPSPDQPPSPVSGMVGLSFSDDDDREFLSAAEAITQ